MASPRPTPAAQPLLDHFVRHLREGGEADGTTTQAGVKLEAFAEMHLRISVRPDDAVLFRLCPEILLGSCSEGLVVEVIR